MGGTRASPPSFSPANCFDKARQFPVQHAGSPGGALSGAKACLARPCNFVKSNRFECKLRYNRALLVKVGTWRK